MFKIGKQILLNKKWGVGAHPLNLKSSNNFLILVHDFLGDIDFFDYPASEQVRSICETFLNVIIDKVKAGEDVTLLNFLKFERVLVKERTFSIPNSEEKTTKPEHYSMKVKIMDGTKATFENIAIVPAEIQSMNRKLDRH